MRKQKSKKLPEVIWGWYNWHDYQEMSGLINLARESGIKMPLHPTSDCSMVTAFYGPRHNNDTPRDVFYGSEIKEYLTKILT